MKFEKNVGRDSVSIDLESNVLHSSVQNTEV
jgi:hypothetical protein